MRGIPGYSIVRLLPRGEDKSVRVICRKLEGAAPAGVVPAGVVPAGAAPAGGVPAGAGEAFRLFPGGRSLRIKHQETLNGQRVLAVRGVSRAELLPGACIVPAVYPVSEERDVLVLSDGAELPTGSELVRGGLHPDFNRERLVGRALFRGEGSFFHIRFPRPYPVMPGMLLSILSGSGESGGSVRNFTLLHPGRPSAAEMRRLNASARRRPHAHPEDREVFLRLLHLKGFVALPPELTEGPWEGAVVSGSWVMLDEEKSFLERKIKKLCSRPGGAEEAQLSVPGRPREMVRELARSMREKGVLVDRGKWLFPAGPPPLSPYHRGWLEKVQAAGPEGLRLSALKNEAEVRALEELGRSGLVHGGGSLWLSDSACRELRGKLLDGQKNGDLLTMAGSRERLGGSRAVTLEVLEILEAEGVLSAPEAGRRRIVSC